MTPEGRIKKVVTALLKSRSDVYYFMPVPSGYGESTLDYIVCCRGRFCAVETKAPGKKPTNRQMQIMAAIERAGGQVFVIDSPEVGALAAWLEEEA